jgi:DNA-binding GntR family transcriptional regulator
MTAPNTFERVYQAIKRWLVAGDFRPGDRLEPVHLSERVNSSVTPVREALQRLVGERLVEAPRNEGFRVPLASEVTLRHLYAWHRDLLLLALSSRGLEHASHVGEDKSQPRIEREQRLFVGIADATGNFEHVCAFHALLERLEPYQRIEEQLLDALEDETIAISRAIREHDRRELRRLLVAYHRRRNLIIPELIALANRRDRPALQ